MTIHKRRNANGQEIGKQFIITTKEVKSLDKRSFFTFLQFSKTGHF